MMQENLSIGSMDAVLDELYGKVGSPEREEFRREAYFYWELGDASIKSE